MELGIGQPVPRIEDHRFIRGKGQFSDDLNFDGQAYAYVVRSPHAHAHIREIDTGGGCRSTRSARRPDGGRIRKRWTRPDATLR